MAQRPASYVVICHEQEVYKLLEEMKIVNTITPMSVLDKSVADVSSTGSTSDKRLQESR